MKVVIIEDEFYAAEALEKMLHKLRPDISVIQKISGVEEGIAYFDTHPEPDLVFSDIQLSDGLAFEIYKKHPIVCPVVFTTAFDQYAIQAFELNSINYILKPIKETDLHRALLKYAAHYEQLPINFEKLRRMLHQPTYKTRFIGKIGQNIQVVPVEDIAFFMSEEGTTFLLTAHGKRLIVDFTLEQLEQILDPQIFFRLNRQLLIHIQSIKKVEPYFKGRLLISLHPETEKKPVVSQEKARVFKEWLG